jgi:hypothetical protein
VTFLDLAVDPRDADDPAGALRPVPFPLADRGTRTGIFASRYPARPNRVGLSLVRIERVGATELEFSGVDLFDGTPVLDIKPWVSDFDLPAGSHAPAGTRCGWFDTLDVRPMTLDDPAPRSCWWRASSPAAPRWWSERSRSTGSARPMQGSWRSTTDVGAGPVGCSTARSMASSRCSCNARSAIPPTLRVRISSSSTSPTSRRARRD